MAHGGSWWRSGDGLRRFVFDFVAGELSHLRPGAPVRRDAWSETLALDADLGVDSLELLALAGAFAQSLHLHESGVEDWLLARRRLADWIEIARAGLEHFEDSLTFRTSGSTGTPKPCVHSLATLRQETRQLAALFPARSRVLCAVPAHHIYGFLFTVLLPRTLGLPDDAVVDVRGSVPASLARIARAGDLVVGHPDFWSAAGQGNQPLPPDVIGVTSTAPCPDGVSAAMERAGLSRLFQIYGSSETAGIGWRSSQRDPYALFPHWSFASDEDALVRRLPDGSLQPASSPDALQRIGERHFRVGPRHDDAVQVGGTNVFPAQVRDVLLAHPMVEDAAVRLMRPEEGGRLKAFVVPKRETEGLQVELQKWIATRLPTAARPKAITLGNALPTSDAGKLADWPVVR
ncbi:MAG TPA: AMP-binding protein [Ramlibacter sp.]|jgi:4-coumarate--CoA ligase (photoactive yellow protein activation family)